jgi:hypothetical protein
MAWTTPPTFTDGTILTAANLNILTDDLAYLEGRANAPLLPYVAYTFTVTRTLTYMIRHKYRYLHYSYANAGTVSGDNHAISITYNNATIYTQNPVVFATDYTGSIDLQATTPSPFPLGLSVGTWYLVRIVFTKVGTGEHMQPFRYLEERDVA